MVRPLRKVPIHLQSSQNRIIIKNGTVVNYDKEENIDIFIEVSNTVKVDDIISKGIPSPI